jgi:hypothetical protein
MPAFMVSFLKQGSWLSAAAGAALALGATPASASEGGASFYLLGSGGPGNAVLPPFQGLYFNNTSYYYSGSASGGKEFVVGGNVVAGLKAKIAADFATVMWVPSTDVLGGTLAVGGAFAAGYPKVKVNAVLTGPRGGQIAINAKDSDFIIGDPVFFTTLGWDVGGDVHVAATATVNVPVGHYRQGELANLSFHRWVADTSLGVSWHDPKAGWDVSGKAGVTFNGTNHFTNYNSGTEFHIEGSVERIFSPKFSAGLQAFYYRQLTGDSGSGAALGANKGRVTGLGATAAYSFTVGRTPVTARLQLFKELNVVRRLQGEIAMFSLSLPLKMKVPPSAGHPPE